MEDKKLLTKMQKEMTGLLVIALLGIFSFALFFKNPPWDILISNFIYFLGLTQGALIIAVILRIASAKWSSPFYRLASSIALAFFPLAVIMFLAIILFKDYIFYWTDTPVHSFWLNSTFFIMRNAITLLIFYGLAWILFEASRPKLSGNFNFSTSDEKKLNKTHLRLGLFLLMAFFVNETIVSWDFGMTMNPHYGETIYSVVFIGGSTLKGAAFLTLSMFVLKNYLGISLFKKDQFANMGQLLLGFVLLMIYFRFSQFLPIWYANLPMETETFYLRVFSYKTIFVLMILMTFAIPFIALIFSKIRNSEKALALISVIILIGMWLENYLMVTPALALKHKIAETPIFHPVNIVFTIGILSGFIYLLFSFLRNNPEAITTSEEDILVTKAEGWK